MSAIFLFLAIIFTMISIFMGWLVFMGNAMRSDSGPMEGGGLFLVPFLIMAACWFAWAAL